MSDLYQNGGQQFGELIIPESFEEALSYAEQLIWLFLNKQNNLVQGDNITLTPNSDGTVTISANDDTDTTYRIDSVTPDEGYVAAYVLTNIATGEQAGEKIQIPTVAGPQGPQGPQGPAGADGDLIWNTYAEVQIEFDEQTWVQILRFNISDLNGDSGKTPVVGDYIVQNYSGQTILYRIDTVEDATSKVVVSQIANLTGMAGNGISWIDATRPEVTVNGDMSTTSGTWSSGTHVVGNCTFRNYISTGLNTIVEHVFPDGSAYSKCREMRFPKYSSSTDCTKFNFTIVKKSKVKLYSKANSKYTSSTSMDNRHPFSVDIYTSAGVFVERLFEHTPDSSDPNADIFYQSESSALEPGSYYIQLGDYTDGTHGAGVSSHQIYVFALKGEQVFADYTRVTIYTTDGMSTSFDVPDGAPGQGVPAGGSRYQILTKGALDDEWNWTRVVGLSQFKAAHSLWGSASDYTHKLESITVNNSSFTGDCQPLALLYVYRNSGSSDAVTVGGGSIKISLDLSVTVPAGAWQTNLHTNGEYGSSLRLPISGTFSAGGVILGFSDEKPTLSATYNLDVPGLAIFTDTTTGTQYIKRANISMSTDDLGQYYFSIGICNRTPLPAGTYDLIINGEY